MAQYSFVTLHNTEGYAAPTCIVEAEWKKVFIGVRLAAHLHFALQLSELLFFKLQVVGELLTFGFQLSNSTPQGVCALAPTASRESEGGKVGGGTIDEIKLKSGRKT